MEANVAISPRGRSAPASLGAVVVVMGMAATTTVAVGIVRHRDACDGASRKREGRVRFSPGRGWTVPLLHVTCDQVEMQHGHCVPTTSHSRS